MLPQIKSTTLSFSLLLDDDEYPELSRIRFEPVSSELCKSFRFLYDTGYGPEGLWVIRYDSQRIIMLDMELHLCEIDLTDDPEDISHDIYSSLDIDQDEADRITVCLPLLLAGLETSLEAGVSDD